jgi:putative ATP-dependent endonuclease of the OLD family
MYLSRLYIAGYRSLRELDLTFGKGKNVIIGRNNSGKSNIVKGLDLVLGESSPTYAKSENVTINDFFTARDAQGELQKAEEIFIWCELTRNQDEPLNYDEMYKCYGYSVAAEFRSGPMLRADATKLPQDHNDLFDLTEDNSPGKTYINPKIRNQQTFEQQFEDKYYFAFAFLARRDEENRIIKDIRFLYRENRDADWVHAFKANIRNELLQSAIIPSFRDPQQQLRLSNWTWYGKLMRHLTSQHGKNVELSQALGQVQTVAKGIFETVEHTIAESTLDVAFPGTELSFQFSTDNDIDLYKSCHLYVDDGFKSPLTDKGSGIQSATIIGLFNYYTQHVNTVTAALLCIEEPELYLHPHARRVISQRLDEFVGTRNQVVITTHSAEFLTPTTKDLTLTIIKKHANETTGTRTTLNQYRDLLLNQSNNELFFADRVVICEGHDEHVLRAVAQAKFPKTLDEQNVSIISAGGKDNIRRLAQLVLSIKTPVFVLADFDYLLRDQSDDRYRYGDIRARESLQSLGLKFFEQAQTCGGKGPRAYGRLQTLRQKLKTENEAAFYTAKRASAFTEPTLDTALRYLRAHGIGILSGEIEDAFKDHTIAGPDKKLSLEGATLLNQRLNEGANIDDLVDTTEISEFLTAALQTT